MHDSKEKHAKTFFCQPTSAKAIKSLNNVPELSELQEIPKNEHKRAKMT